jgi:hypothetical protein
LRVITLLLAILIVTNTAYADAIGGAFGLKLGAVFKGPLPEPRTLTNGTPAYPFTPANPYRAFNEYYSTVSPRSHRITQILALGVSDSDLLCDSERAVLKSILEKKYVGTFVKRGTSNNAFLLIGDRFIALSCKGFTPPVQIKVRVGSLSGVFRTAGKYSADK